MNLPTHIAELVSTAVEQLDPNGNLVDACGAEHRALPLLADLGGGWFFRPDEIFLEVRWDENEHNPDELTATLVAALVVGTERFPWLAELLPKRPPDAVECPQCHGRGKLFVAGADQRSGFLCAKCNVLGWTRP